MGRASTFGKPGNTEDTRQPWNTKLGESSLTNPMKSSPVARAEIRTASRRVEATSRTGQLPEKSAAPNKRVQPRVKSIGELAAEGF